MSGRGDEKAALQRLHDEAKRHGMHLVPNNFAEVRDAYEADQRRIQRLTLALETIASHTGSDDRARWMVQLAREALKA